jgi:hypothetical protein
MGGFLVSKFVKPTKALSSWPPHQRRVNQLLLAQAESRYGQVLQGFCGKRILARKMERSISLGAFANPTQNSNLGIEATQVRGS